MRSGSLLVVCAPSGTGKTSLVHALVARDDNVRVSVSHTTRKKRPGETDGKDYFFVSPKEFAAMQQRGDFLESATVYGHSYGTSQKEIQQALASGVDLILEIDWQGAQQIAGLMDDAVVVGIVPPSIKELEQRLLARAKDSPEVIAKRMQSATMEVEKQLELGCDYLVVNDNFDTALENLQTVVAASRLRVGVNQLRYNALLKR